MGGRGPTIFTLTPRLRQFITTTNSIIIIIIIIRFVLKIIFTLF